MVNYGVIKEVTESFINTSVERNTFGEIRRHTYSLTDDAEKIWKTAQQKPEYRKWYKALQAINKPGISQDFNKLSIAAKVHYIVSWEGESKVGKVEQVAEEYGWNVSEDDIESVLSFLTDLGLVTPDESDDIPF